MFIERWMDKENMDGPRDSQTEWSKSEEDKYHKVSLICGNFKNDTSELNRNRPTGIEMKLTVTKWKRGREG